MKTKEVTDPPKDKGGNEAPSEDNEVKKDATPETLYLNPELHRLIYAQNNDVGNAYRFVKAVEGASEEHLKFCIEYNSWMYWDGNIWVKDEGNAKSIRLFIIDTTPFNDEENPDHIICKKVFINPKIISKSGDSWSFSEGCLSIPEVREDVKRLSEITIEYFDKDFNKLTEIYDGLNARVILHEYDHIEGILFVDKISPLRKRMIKGKLKDISNGTLNANYLIRSFK